MTPEQQADAVLRAAGSSLAKYSMPGKRAAILAAVQAVLLEGVRIGIEAGAQESADYLNGDDFDSRDCDIVLPERIMTLDPAAVLARHGGA